MQEIKQKLDSLRALRDAGAITEADFEPWGSHKLVHRDIKPDNLFITEPEGVIKVLDFGLAARVRSTASNAGIPVLEKAGTLDYAPPEAAAKQKVWHPGHDVYSLAVVLYQLLDPEHDLPFHQRTPGTPWPAQPEGMGDAQWEVLKQGLAYRQEDRAAAAGAFLDALDGAEQRAAERRDEAARELREETRSGWDGSGYPPYIESDEQALKNLFNVSPVEIRKMIKEGKVRAVATALAETYKIHADKHVTLSNVINFVLIGAMAPDNCGRRIESVLIQPV